jgi:hypothetical protein
MLTNIYVSGKVLINIHISREIETDTYVSGKILINIHVSIEMLQTFTP